MYKNFCEFKTNGHPIVVDCCQIRTLHIPLLLLLLRLRSTSRAGSSPRHCPHPASQKYLRFRHCHCCSELLISCQIENKKWQNRKIFYVVYHYLLPKQRTSNETSPIIKTFLKCMIWCCVKQVQGPHLKLVIFPSQLPGKLHPGAVPAQKQGFVILFVNLDPGWRMTLYQKEKN